VTGGIEKFFEIIGHSPTLRGAQEIDMWRVYNDLKTFQGVHDKRDFGLGKE
jgi:hypothetical protein